MKILNLLNLEASVMLMIDQVFNHKHNEGFKISGRLKFHVCYVQIIFIANKLCKVNKPIPDIVHIYYIITAALRHTVMIHSVGIGVKNAKHFVKNWRSKLPISVTKLDINVWPLQTCQSDSNILVWNTMSSYYLNQTESLPLPLAFLQIIHPLFTW